MVVDFLQMLQDSAFGVWVSTSPSLFAYPTILMLHTVGLAMVVSPVGVRTTSRVVRTSILRENCPGSVPDT